MIALMLSKSKKSTYKMSGKELEQVGEIQAKVIRFPKLSEERRVQSGTEGANGPLRCRRGLTPGGPPDARATDVNVVGAPRREARPRPSRGLKSRPADLRRLRAFFCRDFWIGHLL